MLRSWGLLVRWSAVRAARMRTLRVVGRSGGGARRESGGAGEAPPLRAGRTCGPRAAQRRGGGEPEPLIEVSDGEAVALEQAIRGRSVPHVDLDQLPAHLDAEAEALPFGRQARGEADVAVAVAQAAEAGDEREPGAAAGGDVDP